MTMTVYDVAIVGGGPAGISAATALAQSGVGNIVLLDRDLELGGIPRHTEHLGFGLRDMHRVLSGPRYAAALRARAARAGVEIRTSTTAIDWVGPTSLRIVDSGGISQLAARTVVLTTGVRERPRAARLVAGDRPSGVFTTGSLQQLWVFHRLTPGRRAVIVGAEHVSFSAVLTLRQLGCDVAAMVTPFAREQTYAPLRWATANRHRVPIIVNDDVVEIHGRDRVQAVTLRSGQRIPCDTVVFTGDWIPEHELSRRGSLTLDPSHLGAAVDQALRTSRPGVFAAGNLIHPAETADRCAVGGQHVVSGVRSWLSNQAWPTRSLPIHVDPPLRWITPHHLHPGHGQLPDRLILRVDQIATAATARVGQGDRELWSGRIRGKAIPNRSISIPGRSVAGADPDGEPIIVRLQT